MKQRQTEGIRMAKLRGVKFGRPSTPTPDNFDSIVKLYKEKKITVITAINMSGLTRGTFYRKMTATNNDVFSDNRNKSLF